VTTKHDAMNLEDPQGARKAVLLRALLALILIGVLLAALLYFESQQGDASPLPRLAGVKAPDIGVSVATPAVPEPVPEVALAELPVVDESAPEAGIEIVPEDTFVPEPVASAPEVAQAAEPSSASTRGVDRLVIAAPPRAAAAPKPQIAVSSSSSVASKAAAQTAKGTIDASFLLQLGVFSNRQNAEALHERLKQAGIPVQLETRVQVGPFSSREEAWRAQEKLRALGLEQGMLVPQARKP
jgi:DedD protein